MILVMLHVAIIQCNGWVLAGAGKEMAMCCSIHPGLGEPLGSSWNNGGSQEYK